MKRRALRSFVLLWLGWYLSGPAAEMVDFWDTPRQEMRDIMRVAGGVMALVGTALAITLSQVSKLAKRLRLTARSRFIVIISAAGALPLAFVAVRLHPPHSPPIPLRV